jgi:putative spermidine/putrescine transport system ATP-binding protein
MTPANIALRHVGKQFGSTIAVDDLNLEVRAGEFVSLLGPSGCGKTTTLRMIAGLEQPSRGEILSRNNRINDVPVHRRNFGMVFQDHALFPHRTAFENIAFGLKFRRVERNEIERRVRRALDIVRLPNIGDRLPRQLSGGQQQRVALARAVVIEPDLLLFDEPLSALDANLREEMRVELKRIHRTLGITAIYVTHDQSEALSMSDRVVLMNNGRIEQEGTPDMLYQAPVSEFAARFFGHLNELTASVVEATGSGCRARLADGTEIMVAAPRMAVGRDLRLFVRAERATVRRSNANDSAHSEHPGTIVSVDYLGMLSRYVVELSGVPFVVLQASNEAETLRPTEQVTVRIPTDAWLTFEGAADAR